MYVGVNRNTNYNEKLQIMPICQTSAATFCFLALCTSAYTDTLPRLKISSLRQKRLWEKDGQSPNPKEIEVIFYSYYYYLVFTTNT